VFDAIAGAGRDAMTQLRRILGVLKEEPVQDGSAQDGSDRSPQPGVAALAGLVRRTGDSTGLRVELRSAGEARPLHRDTEVAAYRVVQEALTNTVKHAYASRVRVELDWTEHELTLTVTDDGRSPGGTRAGGGGHGLIGIRERAAACGGTARTGPARDGGFQVVVRLPVAAGRQAAPG
jgi:signal transduction histidine kinase